MKDKVVIISGAARGLGQKYSCEFAKAGAKVVFADVNPCNDTEDEIKKITNQFLNLSLDVTNFSSCDNLAKQTKEKFGRIDVLVNNAALYGALKSKQIELYYQWGDKFLIILRCLFIDKV